MTDSAKEQFNRTYGDAAGAFIELTQLARRAGADNFFIERLTRRFYDAYAQVRTTHTELSERFDKLMWSQAGEDL